jgi:pimeloyl-ACP methyl ester carboxylesterase
VGHAYGGFVITNAAYNNPDVKGLVYVAAPAPMEGQGVSGDMVYWWRGIGFAAAVIYLHTMCFIS